jgi:hypothetical protein
MDAGAQAHFWGLYDNTTSMFGIGSGAGNWRWVNSNGTLWNLEATGNFVQSIANKGINFTANTPAAGMTSQLLNWYEEGTWTPTDGSGAGLTFSTATGTYTRIGRSVTLQFVVAYPVTASVAATKISGVPFTSLNQCVGSCINNKINAAPYIAASGTGINLYDLNGLNNYSNVSFSNGTIIGTITYFV